MPPSPNFHSIKRTPSEKLGPANHLYQINTTAHLSWRLFKHNPGINLLEIESYGSVTRENFPFSPKPIQLRKRHHHSAFPYQLTTNSNEFLPRTTINMQERNQKMNFLPSFPRKPLTQANLPDLIWGGSKMKIIMIRLGTKYTRNKENRTESGFSLKHL